MSHESKLEDLRRLREQARLGGGEDRIDAQHGPPRMQQHWHHERHREEDDLPRNEHEEILAAWARDLVVADAPAAETEEVIEEMPLECEKTVEEPQVDTLSAMEPESLLVRREAGEETDVDVVVVPIDVRVGVVKCIVLPGPQI